MDRETRLSRKPNLEGLEPSSVINRNKQNKSNYVNKMPISSSGFKRKVMVEQELGVNKQNKHIEKKRSPHYYMHTMEPSC